MTCSVTVNVNHSFVVKVPRLRRRRCHHRDQITVYGRLLPIHRITDAVTVDSIIQERQSISTQHHYRQFEYMTVTALARCKRRGSWRASGVILAATKYRR